MKCTLLKRLEKLEKHPRCQPPHPPSARDLLFQEKFWELLGQMDQKYAEIVCADRRIGADPERQSALTNAFMHRLLDHFERGTPLAFPAVVAEAYLANPKAGEDVECEECGYKLPMGLVTICPVCGRGSVWHYYDLSVRKNLALQPALLALLADKTMTPK